MFRAAGLGSLEEDKEEKKISLPHLRHELAPSILEKYQNEIHEFYVGANRTCVGGGALFDGASSRACAAAALLLSQQSIYKDDIGCVVVHSKDEVEVLDDIRKRMFPSVKGTQMVVVEFEELEKDFLIACPVFANSLNRLKITGEGRALARVKREMKAVMDLHSLSRGRIFSPSLPYPQTIVPLLELTEADDRFHIYKHDFSFLLVLGIPTTELQVHAINSICADTRWVSPYSLPIDEERDDIEEDRKAMVDRISYLIALSNNQEWAKDLSVFHPWSSNLEGEDVQRRSTALAMVNSYVVRVPDSFWAQRAEPSPSSVKKKRGPRKQYQPLLKEITSDLNIQHHMFIVSMPKDFHESEKKQLDALFRNRRHYGNQEYLAYCKGSVALMDEHLRVEQVQLLLRQFPRYDLNRTAIVTSSERMRKTFACCRTIHPGLRVVLFDHSSLRKKSEIQTHDEDGRPLPPLERVVITDPFALSERPDRSIFSTLGNNLVFTWVVTRYGIDKIFASHLMAMEYDYKLLYTRTSRVPLDKRSHGIFARSFEEHRTRAYHSSSHSEGHYYDQESSYYSKDDPHHLDYMNGRSLLSHQIEEANALCEFEDRPLYRLHLPTLRENNPQEWQALPFCVLRSAFDFIEKCMDVIDAFKNKKLNNAIVAYRKHEPIQFVSAVSETFKIVNRRAFCFKQKGAFKPFEALREEVFVNKQYISKASVEEVLSFFETRLEIAGSLFLERKRNEEIDLVPLDLSLMIFAVQHRTSVMESSCPAAHVQLSFSNLFSQDPRRNALYFLACANLHTLSIPVFDKDSGELCLLTAADGLLGYTDEGHARKVLGVMAKTSLNSQWLAFCPSYAEKMIRELFVAARREIEIVRYCDDWSSITLCPIRYSRREQNRLVTEFVEAEGIDEDDYTRVVSVEDFLRHQKVRARQQRLAAAASSSSSGTAVIGEVKRKEKKRKEETMLPWRQIEQENLKTSAVLPEAAKRRRTTATSFCT